MSVVVAVATGSSSSPIAAQDVSGSDLYEANCAGCHQTNGEGIPGTFPPIAGNPAAADSEYVAIVITDGKTGEIEVLGETYNSAMPAVAGLSDGDLDAVVGHVVELAGGANEPETPTEPVGPPESGDIDSGHDLFIGQDQFDNDGTACASCHTAGEVGNLGGSSLGPDLTGAYELLGGQAGLSAWLANPPAPTMTPIFADRPLTDDEIADLVAFLADAPSQDRPSNDVDWLVIAGIAGLLVLIGGMAIAWRGPRRTYVETLRSKR
jgi:ubiquinol-cytochrome c reductase cytochrome c subunit